MKNYKFFTKFEVNFISSGFCSALPAPVERENSPLTRGGKWTTIASQVNVYVIWGAFAERKPRLRPITRFGQCRRWEITSICVCFWGGPMGPPVFCCLHRGSGMGFLSPARAGTVTLVCKCVHIQVCRYPKRTKGERPGSGRQTYRDGSPCAGLRGGQRPRPTVPPGGAVFPAGGNRGSSLRRFSTKRGFCL